MFRSRNILICTILLTMQSGLSYITGKVLKRLLFKYITLPSFSHPSQVRLEGSSRIRSLSGSARCRKCRRIGALCSRHSRAIRTGSRRWPSRPTVGSWPRPLRTRRLGSGTRPQARPVACYRLVLQLESYVSLATAKRLIPTRGG
jgi:hypothetical protein